MTLKISTMDENKGVWIISESMPTTINLNGIIEGGVTGPVREYKISDIGHYMLNPCSIEIEEKLIGCEVHFNQPLSNKIVAKIKRIVPQSMHSLLPATKNTTDKVITSSKLRASFFKDRHLELHFNKLNDALRPYDPTLKKLLKLDASKISNITGICEDAGGNQYQLNLQGSVFDKINYIVNFLLKNVKVTLKRSYLSDGLFEMRGYGFQSFDSSKTYRLIKFFKEGKTRYCVLNNSNSIEFWIEDIKTVYLLHLLEQSLEINPKLKESFDFCINGDAKPLKLFFNKQLEVDYTKADLPKVYKEVFNECDIGLRERDIIKSSLNSMQRVILFNYVPQTENGEERLYTNISIMHDFRALEPLKTQLPHLYSTINKMAPVSEAGKFYLLDSMRGYGDGK